MTKFKVGDKVILDPKGHWSSWETKNAAKEGTILTVERVAKYGVSATIDGKFFPHLSVDYTLPAPAPAPAPAEPRDTRAETIAYLQGQLEKANADQMKAQKDEEAAFKRRVALGERRAELNAQIKLLGGGVKEFKVGARVKVTAEWSVHFGKEFIIDKVYGTDTTPTYYLNRVSVGPNPSAGYLASELELV